MRYRDGIAALVLAVSAGGLLTGCGQSQAGGPPPAPPPPEVKVALPISAKVTDFQDFPGRLSAVNAVEVRSRVTGYLDKVMFKDGDEVKQGDVLCQIDPRPYEAELSRAKGNVEQAESRLARLESDYERALALNQKKAISKEDFDRISSDRSEAKGLLAVNKAARDLAQLNVDFTKVTAPLTGRIGNRMLDAGNLVKADDTPITVIVSTDPVYAYFDLDERTMLRLKRLFAQGAIKWVTTGEKDKKDRRLEGLSIRIGLADEEGFPHDGAIDFADNRVDADSGTWRLRGTFQNPDNLLTPGLFVRVRLMIGGPEQVTMVAEEALVTDQGQKYVWVVGKDNKVEYRRIKIGRLHDGMRVVTENLKTGEPVIISGLQRARPGIEVNPGEGPIPMPGADRLKSPEEQKDEPPAQGLTPESAPKGDPKDPVGSTEKPDAARPEQLKPEPAKSKPPKGASSKAP